MILADAATTEAGRGRRSVYRVGRSRRCSSTPPARRRTSPRRWRSRGGGGGAEGRILAQALRGMTRAEDELYVTGYLTKTGKLDGHLVRGGRAGAGGRSRDRDSTMTAPYARWSIPRDAAGRRRAAGERHRRPRPPCAAHLPALPPYRPRRIVRPSSAYAEAAARRRVFETAAEHVAPRDAGSGAAQTGMALHALLQHLGRRRRARLAGGGGKACRCCCRMRPRIGSRSRPRPLSILTRPEFAELFGPTLRAEVPFLLEGTPQRRAGAPRRAHRSARGEPTAGC